LEGCDRGVFQTAIPALAWRKWEKDRFEYEVFAPQIFFLNTSREVPNTLNRAF